jgi:Uri superfamily endonuclease
MHPLPGTYALIFSAYRKSQLKIGKLGTLQLKPGFYIYVGSAFGPGGLKARIAHHRKRASRPHWHIDYLSSFLELIEIWHTYDPIHREHQWAKTLSGTRGATIPLIGFGSSDCRCNSHLFYFDTVPSGRSFRRNLSARYKKQGKVAIEKPEGYRH